MSSLETGWRVWEVAGHRDEAQNLLFLLLRPHRMSPGLMLQPSGLPLTLPSLTELEAVCSCVCGCHPKGREAWDVRNLSSSLRVKPLAPRPELREGRR